MIPDTDGDQIDVWVLTSPDLPRHRQRLDPFEDDVCQRVAVPVETPDGPITASIYARATPPDQPG